MKKSNRLATLAKFEALKEQKKLLVMLDAKRQFEKQESLSQQLSSYIDDYEGINNHSDNRLIDSNLLRNASHFMKSLTQALVLQNEQSAKYESDFHGKHQTWQQAHARGKAINQRVEAYRDVELQEQNKADDRESEEQWLTIAHRRKLVQETDR